MLHSPVFFYFFLELLPSLSAEYFTELSGLLHQRIFAEYLPNIVFAGPGHRILPNLIVLIKMSTGFCPIKLNDMAKIRHGNWI
jgi:hypothetical protein